MAGAIGAKVLGVFAGVLARYSCAPGIDGFLAYVPGWYHARQRRDAHITGKLL